MRHCKQRRYCLITRLRSKATSINIINVCIVIFSIFDNFSPVFFNRCSYNNKPTPCRNNTTDLYLYRQLWKHRYTCVLIDCYKLCENSIVFLLLIIYKVLYTSNDILFKIYLMIKIFLLDSLPCFKTFTIQRLSVKTLTKKLS